MKSKIGALVLLLMTAGPAWAQSAEDWAWTIAPYFWASDVGLDLTINGDTSIGGDADFRDLLDKVDMAFMGHAEGRKGRWGMYLDTIYMELSDSKSVSVGPGGPILRDLTADAGMKLKLYEAGGIYRLNAQNAPTRFDVLAGLRYIDLDVDALLTLPGPAMNEIPIQTGPSETDLMLGVRAIGRFSERWNWGLRADYSFIGTEGTFNGLAMVGYTFGDSGLFSLELGYRYMSIEIDGTSRRGAATSADIVMSGPVVGAVFNF